MPSKLGLQAAFRARQSIGVAEEKPNWGKWVSIYLKFVGYFRPAPWCAAFVAYKVHQAAGDLKAKAAWPKTAGCDEIYRWAKKTGNVLESPEPGCVFLVGSPKDYTHTGFVQSVRDGQVITIEGNTNVAGEREGKYVLARTRLAKGLTYIRIV
jgi:hypothetical protein